MFAATRSLASASMRANGCLQLAHELIQPVLIDVMTEFDTVTSRGFSTSLRCLLPMP